MVNRSQQNRWWFEDANWLPGAPILLLAYPHTSHSVETRRPRDWWASLRRREIPLADLGLAMIGDPDTAAGHVGLLGDHVSDQMSIFSAISIASSTSMPR